MNELHISAAAQADLLEIKAYIEQEFDNPAAALAAVRRITNRIRVLRDHAYIGARLSSIVTMESDYRYLVSGQYLIFYRVYGKDIYIDRILHGRRNYMRVLFEGIPPEDPEG